MIRILFVDDHPALQAGLQTVLRAEPGLVPVATAASEYELWPALTRTRPDVVLLDYHLPGTDGLQLCHRIKRETPAPRVLIYSAYADAALAVPAVVAGADGLIHKSVTAHELVEAVRLVAKGTPVFPDVSAEELGRAMEQLDLEDRPIVAMLMDHESELEIAGALRREPDDVRAAISRVLGRLRVAVPGSRS